jgi:high mobility group protein B1
MAVSGSVTRTFDKRSFFVDVEAMMNSQHETSGATTDLHVHKLEATVKKPSRKPVKYCKDPRAPKRFKSAFIFFTMDRHKALRKKLEESKGAGDNTPDVAKLISSEWRNQSAKDRAVWDEKARLDKERYEVEKAMYTGPWKIPTKKKALKDRLCPKRPMSSFLSYSNSKRAELKLKNPGMNNAEASKLLAAMWRKAPEEEKKEHIEREQRLRDIYKKDMTAWREKKSKEQTDVREKREEEAMNIVQGRAAAAAQSGYGAISWGSQVHRHRPYYGDANDMSSANMPPQQRWAYPPYSYPLYPHPMTQSYTNQQQQSADVNRGENNSYGPQGGVSSSSQGLASHPPGYSPYKMYYPPPPAVYYGGTLPPARTRSQEGVEGSEGNVDSPTDENAQKRESKEFELCIAKRSDKQLMV